MTLPLGAHFSPQILHLSLYNPNMKNFRHSRPPTSLSTMLGMSSIYYRGCVKPPKSFWFSMSWNWQNWIAIFTSSTQHPGTLPMTNDLEASTKAVPRIEPT
jgi:hypothetical protein